MKDAYDWEVLKRWVADINMDNLPKVPSKNRGNYAKGFGDDFTSDFMEAMGELRDSVKVNANNNANVTLANIKGAINRGKLRKLQWLKNTRHENRKESGDIKFKGTVEVRAQLESVGITEEDSIDTNFQKLKEAFDRGEV